MNERIFITGSSGALGTELKKQFPDALCPTHDQLDIADARAVNEFIRKHDISTIIHAAALTSIRQCEANQALAWKTNVEGTRNLIESLKRLHKKIPLIYISTACVFHGDESMYTELSVPYPVNFYSTTKLIGENIVRTLDDSLVVRTNFVSKKKWPYPRAFSDRFGTYLFADNVSLAIREVYEEKLRGTVHVVGDKVLSMYELARITTPDIEPMTINDYDGPHLTMNMTLDTVRWKKYKIQ